MGNIRQKTKSGVWYVSYRQGGILKHRSLGAKSGAEARRLKKEIELKAEANPNVELFVSEWPKTGLARNLNGSIPDPLKLSCAVP
jgi:hypothetical protein